MAAKVLGGCEILWAALDITNEFGMDTCVTPRILRLDRYVPRLLVVLTRAESRTQRFVNKLCISGFEPAVVPDV